VPVDIGSNLTGIRLIRTIHLSLVSCLVVACQTSRPETSPPPPADQRAVVSAPPTPVALPAPVPVPAPPVTSATAPELPGTPVTLPVLDAMFADPMFAGALKAALDLTDEQVEQLRTSARAETKALMVRRGGGAREAASLAHERIRGTIGDAKTEPLVRFVRDYWTRDENGEVVPASGADEQPGRVPSDTRIVVNAPAYRMDVFHDGALLATYRIGIGYPEFPLPTGTRTARSIIFNPTWTPPDESWVTGEYTVGKRVAAGSEQNPLGVIKIPIGMPSLIHGGKQAKKLGGFASHGCVGLTNTQVQTLARTLAEVTNTTITPEELRSYAKDNQQTVQIKLTASVPIELRYETIVVEAGKLRIYRDVYERGTNTEDNLQRVLEAAGVPASALTDVERARVTTGLQRMALDAGGGLADHQSTSLDVTRRIKGAKVVEISIAALTTQGYPAPVKRPLRHADKPTWW
jgi:lipoprotein-anchoring transpeptidase ErfK/SrfK